MFSSTHIVMSDRLTSVSNSEAAVRCRISGCAMGDSRAGSSGSRGVIRWAIMQTFGSDTSSTDIEFVFDTSRNSLVMGICKRIVAEKCFGQERDLIRRQLVSSKLYRYACWQESIQIFHRNNEAISI